MILATMEAHRDHDRHHLHTATMILETVATFTSTIYKVHMKAHRHQCHQCHTATMETHRHQ